MFNKNMANLLNEMGDLLELDQANPFRIRAFRRGAEVVESHSEDLSELPRKSLLAIPGIGNGIADMIEEFKSKNEIGEIKKLKKKYPQGVLDMMNLSGLGAKRAAVLFKKLKISNVDMLAKAATANKLVKLSGFGEKLQESLIKNIAFIKEASKRILITEAIEIANHYEAYLKQSPVIKDLQRAGSLRRWKETIGDLDFLCVSQQPEKAMSYFTKYKEVKRVLASGKTKSSVILSNGVQVDFRVVEKKSYGAALMYFTGSKEHNVRLRELAQRKGLTLNEYGLYRLSDKKRTNPVASRTEEEVYKKLGMAWVPPELREDRGEVEAAIKNKLPKLVEEKDVLGDFHNHTTLSDGEDSLEDMIEAASNKKWKWFFSADHSPSLTVASGLPVPILKKKMQSIQSLNKKYKNFDVFCSTEVDILNKGKIDYPDKILEELDCVVASVHSRFSQTKEEMTDRICTAIRNPHVDILGHISGRLLNRREAYSLDFEEVLKTAKETDTAIEINGQSERQELQDIHVKRAVDMGVPLALNTDAHSTSQLDNMTIAVHIARRGWAEKKHIINCMTIKELKKWLAN